MTGHRVFRVSDVPVGSSRVVALEGLTIGVFHLEDGFHALLNRCPHRGVPLSEGNQQFPGTISCPYHGWTFDLAGNLVGVPGLNEYYSNDLDLSAHGLRQVAQVDAYHGFVFGTHDASAPPLLLSAVVAMGSCGMSIRIR
jgi:phenylpropionate dioxygenase-like ring-hydroxylating dioxygenase large terminal subunit